MTTPFLSLLLLAAMLVVPQTANSQQDVTDGAVVDGTPMVIAHRSAEMGGLPENSLAWIQYAIDHGIDGVHINPQLTRDSQYVLMHDNTLNRMTDVEQKFPAGPPGGPTREQRGGLDYVRDYPLSEIRQLHLLPEMRETVPDLTAALDLAQGRVLVFLGLKSYEVESLSAVLSTRANEGLLLHELVYSGTDQSKLRELAQETGLGVIVTLFQSRDYLTDLNAIAKQLGPSLKMVSVQSSRVTPEFLSRMQELGLRLVISGWNGEEDRALLFGEGAGPWQAVLDMGLSAMTDHPVRVMELLKR